MYKLKLIFSTLFLLFFSFSLIGQKLVVSDEVIRYEDQDRMSIQVNLDPEPKAIKDALDDFMDDQYNVNLKGFGFLANKDVLSAEQVSLPQVSEKAFDLYFRVVKNVDGSQLNAFASFGYDVHINPEKYPEAYQELKNIVNHFLNSFLPDYYSGKVEATREFITDLQKDQEEMLEQTEQNKKALDEAATQLKVQQTELTDIRKLLPESERINQ